VVMPQEAEFRAYSLLILHDSLEISTLLLGLSPEVCREPPIRLALQVCIINASRLNDIHLFALGPPSCRLKGFRGLLQGPRSGGLPHGSFDASLLQVRDRSLSPPSTGVAEIAYCLLHLHELLRFYSP